MCCIYNANYFSVQMDQRDWAGIQQALESGTSSCKEVAADFSVTQNQLSWALRKGLVDKSTWKLKRPKHSSATRQKLSTIKKAFYEANPESHPWRQEGKFVSVPCEALKKALGDAGIYYVAEHMPLEGRYYSLDIAFPDIKLGIEVNGNQHYTESGVLKPYYQDRHDNITSSGWQLIELHYSAVYNKQIVETLISDLGVKGRDTKVDYTVYLREKKVKPNLSLTKKIERDKIATNLANIVVEAGIDFSKHGWVKEVSALTGVLHQKVSKWMSQYLPEVYANCFKRK